MKGILRGLAVALAVGLAGARVSSAQELAGRVVGLSDGDTVTVLTAEKRQVRVRLNEIDAPESGQPYGTRARQELSALVFGREVEVVGGGTDRYGRTLGRVLVDGRDANAEMVRRGAAWVYRRYSRDVSLARLEAEAREARRGLWALPEAERIPPWEWRAARRSDEPAGDRTGAAPASPVRVPPSRGEASASGFACGTKRTCGQMAGCAEARFHFERCGLARLDGDRDGVPCERLCR